MDNKITNKYLSDEPIELAASEVAQTIAKEISQQDTKGKIIGILGGWGSGKSSIIAGVKAIIKANKFKNCNFIEYDAWENEKFPFKLGFLEKLIAKCEECFGNDKQVKTFKQDLADLKHLKEVQENQEYSLLNFPNALLAISVLFYPLAFDLLTGEKEPNILFNFESLYVHKNLHIYSSALWVFFGGLLALVANYFLDRKNSILECIKSKKFWKEEIDIKQFIFLILISIAVGMNFAAINYTFIILCPLIIWSIFNLKNFVVKLFKSDMDFYILAGAKPHKESLITINKTPEPSYAEFYELYSKIIKKIIGGNEENKIIIVIDNIDRISSDDAKSIWASLKGMILKEHSVFVMVPIDEEQASSIFKDYATTDRNTESDNEDEIAIKANSFIQKTFDIIYRVPPQSISKADVLWNNKLKDAFNREFSLHEISEIMSIFDTRNYEGTDFYCSSYKGLATPRKIIKIINEVVTLEKIGTFSDISLNTKFAFVIHYHNISKKIDMGILNNLLPNDNNLTNNISNLELAALYFMTDKKEALLLTKKDEIYNQITGDYFSDKNEDIKQEWIWMLLTKILPLKQFESINALINIAYNLVIINNKKPQDMDFQHLLHGTLEKIEKNNDISDLPKNADMKFKVALDNIQGYTGYKRLVRTLFKIKENSNLFQGQKAKEWLGILNSIVEKGNLRTIDLQETVENSLPEQFYLKLIPLLSENDLDLYNLGILHPNISNMDKLSNLNKEELYAHCRFFIKKGNDDYIAWDTLQEFIFDKIEENIQDSQYLYLIADAIKNNYVKYVEDFIKSSPYLTHISHLYSNKSTDFPLALAVYATVSPDFKEFRVNGNTAGKESSIFNDGTNLLEFIKEFLDLNHNDINILLDLGLSTDNRKKVMEFMTIENLGTLNLSGIDMKKFFDKYCSIQPKETAFYILKRISESKNIIQDIQLLKFNKDNEVLMRDLALLISQNNITDNFNDYLNSISTADWKNEIDNISETFKTALLIGFDGKDFKEALIQYLPDALVNSFSDIFKLDNRYILAIKYLKNIRLIINQILDKRIKSEVLIDNKFLETFSEQIIKWLKNSNNNKNDVFIDFIIKINNDEWLIQNSKIITPYISSSEENERSFVYRWSDDECIYNAYKDVFDKISQIDAIKEKNA